MPFLKPFMPQTHTVPGFRLGPDLPYPNPCVSQLPAVRSLALVLITAKAPLAAFDAFDMLVLWPQPTDGIPWGEEIVSQP